MRRGVHFNAARVLRRSGDDKKKRARNLFRFALAVELKRLELSTF